MNSKRTQNIAILEQTPSILREVTAELTDEALDFHSAPDEWSIREILAHLVDDEMYVTRLRLERIIEEEKPHLVPHDEKKWYRTRNTARDHINQLLDDFAIQRAASLGIITLLREEEWQRPGYQPEYGEFTAEQWLDHWAEHDTIHIAQIQRTLKQH